MPIKIISKQIQIFTHVHLSMISPETIKLQVAFLFSTTFAFVLQYPAKLNLFAFGYQVHNNNLSAGI